jgi:hypothetical protein
MVIPMNRGHLRSSEFLKPKGVVVKDHGFKLPENAKDLVEKAKATIAAKKAKISGEKADTEEELAKAMLLAEQAKAKLERIAEQERKVREVEEERIAQENRERIELEAKRAAEEAIRLQKEEEALKEAEEAFTGSKVKAEEQIAISEAIRNPDAVKSARRISRAVATQDEIRVEEKDVQPDTEIDTLCVLTNEIRKDIVNLYIQSGWNVKFEESSYGNAYVFKAKS